MHLPPRPPQRPPQPLGGLPGGRHGLPALGGAALPRGEARHLLPAGVRPVPPCCHVYPAHCCIGTLNFFFFFKRLFFWKSTKREKFYFRHTDFQERFNTILVNMFKHHYLWRHFVSQEQFNMTLVKIGICHLLKHFACHRKSG